LCPHHKGAGPNNFCVRLFVCMRTSVCGCVRLGLGYPSLSGCGHSEAWSLSLQGAREQDDPRDPSPPYLCLFLSILSQSFTHSLSLHPFLPHPSSLPSSPPLLPYSLCARMVCSCACAAVCGSVCVCASGQVCGVFTRLICHALSRVFFNSSFRWGRRKINHLSFGFLASMREPVDRVATPGPPRAMRHPDPCTPECDARCAPDL
jgi:hypothetical protein